MNTIDKIAVAIAQHERCTSWRIYGKLEEYHRDLARAIVEHLDKCGLVIVPGEPTEFMLDCALVAQAHISDDASEVWRAMIAATKESNRDV